MPSPSSDRLNGIITSVAIKAPCRAATTAAVTLSGLQTVDGVVLVDDDSILVQNQTDARENGIYVVSTGLWQRRKDFNGARDAVTGTLVFVCEGTTQGGYFFRLTTPDPVEFGTSEIVWVQAGFSGLDAIAGLSRFSPAFHKFGGQLQGLHSALTDPFNQFISVPLIGDSITWGKTVTGNATSDPRNRTLDDPRDNFASASWANEFKRYVGATYFNDATPTLSNFTGAVSGEAIATYKKNILLYPGSADNFTRTIDGVSCSFDEINTAGAKLGRRFLLVNGDTLDGSDIQITFPYTGKKLKIWYTSIATISVSYELFIGDTSLGVFSTNNGGTVNGLSREHTFDFVHNAVVTIRLVRNAGLAAPTQYVQLEAIEVEKTCQIINQGIIGADTRSCLEFELTEDYPSSGPLIAVTEEDTFPIIMLGTNDRAKFTPTTSAPYDDARGLLTFLDTLGLVVERIQDISPYAKPILMVANPVVDESTSTYDFTMAEARDAILHVGKEKNIDVIDNYVIFRNLVLSNYLADGLHPDENGHLFIFRNIIGALEASASETRFAGSQFFPDDFGATADGSDDSTAIELACAAANLYGGVVQFVAGRTYTFSQLVIPNNTNVRKRGAVIRSDGSLTTAGDITLAIGDDVEFDDLVISTPGTETNTDIISIGSRFWAEYLEVRSDAQRAGGGITCTGDSLRIDYLKTVKIDRPIHLFNQSATTRTEGSYIGVLDVEDYVRAYRADFTSFTIGERRCRGRSANAAKTPGHNDSLLQGCSDVIIGPSFIEDAGEHADRIGGSPHLNAVSKNIAFGQTVMKRSGGCALKINPTLLASVGVTEKASNITHAGFIAMDVGDGTVVGNEELLRLTHVEDVHIEYALAYTDAETSSAQYALQINDAKRVSIGTLGGNAFAAGFVNIDGTSDCDGVAQFGGDVTGLKIDRLIGSCAGNNAIGVSTLFNLADIHINCDAITGFATNVILWTAGTLTGKFHLSGEVTGAVAPAFSSVPNSDNATLDLSYGNTRVMGRIASARFGTTSTLQVTTPAFNPANVPPTGAFLNATQATAGSGNYGSAIELSRVGSSRRGAAIAAKQTGANAENVGISFLYGTATTASDLVNEALVLKHNGRLSFTSITTYADNAAALAGGLVAGEAYWTAAGDLRIVV